MKYFVVAILILCGFQPLNAAPTPTPTEEIAPTPTKKPPLVKRIIRSIGFGKKKQEEPTEIPTTTPTPTKKAVKKTASPSATPAPSPTPTIKPSPKPKSTPTPTPSPTPVSPLLSEPVPFAPTFDAQSTEAPRNDTAEKEKYEQIKQQAKEDADVKKLHKELQASTSPETLTAFYKGLFSKMRNLDPELKDKIDRMERITLKRIEEGKPVSLDP